MAGIFERAISQFGDVIILFRQKMSVTKDSQARKNFPKKTRTTFQQHTKDIIESDHSTRDDATIAKLMTVLEKSDFKKINGIEACINLAEVIWENIKLKNENLRLMQEVKEISTMSSKSLDEKEIEIKKLLRQLTEMQNSIQQCDDDEEDSVDELPMQVTSFLKNIFGGRLTIMDAYLAKDIRYKKPQNRVLVVIYEGEAPLNASCIIDNVVVEFIQRPVVNLYDDMDNWDEFKKNKPFDSATYIEAFYGNKHAVSILNDNADVVAVFPSVTKQPTVHVERDQTLECMKISSESQGSNSFELVPVIVVMKEAPNFVAEGSRGVPDTIQVTGFGEVTVIVVEGYHEPHILRAGSAIGNQFGELGFGTLGAFARLRDTDSRLYAVTCEHVVTSSQADCSSSLFTATSLPTVYSSPTPGWRKFDLIRSLGYATHCPEGYFVKNLDTLIRTAVEMCNDNPDAIRAKMTLVCPSSNTGPISFEEMKNYAHNNLDIIGSNTHTVSPVKISVGTHQVDCTGDIALIEMTPQAYTITSLPCFSLGEIISLLKSTNSNSIWVAHQGAASNSRKLGVFSRPVHIQTSTGYPDFCTDKPIKNSGNRYLCQLMIDGTGFGVKGDSGSSVYLIDSSNQQLGPLIGIFTGSLDRGCRVFLVSPIECLTNNNYEIVSLSK